MATTLIDIAKRNNSDAVVGLIDEAITAFQPEVRMGDARTISGINYETLIRTSIPTGAFRNANEGGVENKSTYTNRLIETYTLDSQFFVDRAVADRSEDGAAAYLADEALGIVQGNIKHLSSQFYYGTVNDSKGFQGVKQFVDPTLVYDNTGIGASTTEVWAVRWGSRDVRWVLGQGGALTMSDVITINKLDANSKTYAAYWQYLLAYVGLQVGSRYSVGSIKNITTAAPLTDNAIAELISLMQNKGVMPDVLYMTPNALKLLQQSRTATNATGQPAPFPTEAFGIPIQVSLGISDTITAY